MAKFSSAKYPALVLQDDKGIWATFADGELETTDAAVVKRLRGLPESEGISEVKAAAKAEDDAKKE
ncbi:hypothetical protein [Streptomyces sp. OR43]|uniref:hypothetical protein n=1 Tax=Streptomyces sp. or43 TaxID=2478957 RepID=UPI0011CD6980|nr:hypothetical protein [Streptomyces sp. or43]TXS35723.1 hypothetical protein EAO72_19075 [Streptomyces sp. or43]